MAERMVQPQWQVYRKRRGKAGQEPVILGRLQSGRPILRNPDGSVSTHRNIVVNVDGQAVLLPTLYNGREVSQEQALTIYRSSGGMDPDTGQPFPTFATDAEALAFEQQQHDALEEEVASVLKRKGR